RGHEPPPDPLDVLDDRRVLHQRQLRPRHEEEPPTELLLRALAGGARRRPRREGEDEHERDRASPAPHRRATLRATSFAKYVITPSAPARLMAVRLWSPMRSSSSQPFAAAAFTIAYSPLTWYAATG